MNQQPVEDEAGADVVFPIEGRFLPRDHAQPLYEALCRQWPQLVQEEQVGIHGIKLVSGGSEPAMLSRRAKLLLRAPRALGAQLLACPGVSLQIDGHTLQLGQPHIRDLQPHTTLYAYHVAAASADEAAFMADVARDLAALGVGGERVCGKRQQMRLGSGAVTTFSLMLHALAPDQSLRLQYHGIGPHRLFGCGLFIPHKSAAAV